MNKTNLKFFSKNKHTIVKSEYDEIIFGCSFEWRIIRVQAQHYSSISLEAIEIKLGYVKIRDYMQIAERFLKILRLRKSTH